MKPIPYGKQYISKEDLEAVSETLQSDFLTQGPKIAEFEKAFGKYMEVSMPLLLIMEHRPCTWLQKRWV